MKNIPISWIALSGLAVLAPGGCEAGDAPGPLASRAIATPEPDKPLPFFPIAYRGAGRFTEVGNPRNHLVAFYEFDMTLGANRERVHYVDREIEILNLYDLEGDQPDREYFFWMDPMSGIRNCTRQERPLPRIFLRDWWIANDMVYQGTETINGFEADCWQGHDAELDEPVRFCNRADAYPGFAPVLKKLGTLEFHDYQGAIRAPGTFPANHFELPTECAGL